MTKPTVLIIVLLLPIKSLFGADDTLRVNWLSEITITANRFENKPSGSGTSVSSLSSEQIETLPAMNISNTLKYLPGLFIVSQDGTGLNPLVTIRGFHGGGESEYLTVLVDGIPVNSLENGLVSWNMLPLNQISKIEILRGGASAIYGDAAMGGVVNLITRKTYEPYTQALLSYGSFNSLNSGLHYGNQAGKGFFDLYANYEHTDGFRENSNYTSSGFGGRFRYPLSNNTSITINSVNRILQMQDPGPLLQEMISEERNRSTSFFQEDGRDQNKYLLGLDLRSKLTSITDLNITLSYQHNNYDASRTYTQPSLILGSNFQPIGVYDTTLYGNTKNRVFTSNQLMLAARLFTLGNSERFRIVGGVDFDLGNFNTEVFDVLKGFESDYENLKLDKSLDFDGKGQRLKSAAYFNGEYAIMWGLKLIGGARYDLISDVFTSDFPVADTSLNKTYHAFSPRIALNLSTGKSESYEGSIFASFGKAFKAPTLDQRTDLKTLNYAMFFQSGPTYQMMIINANPFSNAELKPQRSLNFEIGTYQYFQISESIFVKTNLSLYQIDVEDEIDFDLQEFRYRNISSSRHRGIEAGFSAAFHKNWNIFANYNYSEVKFASGPNKNKILKGIPESFYSAGFSYSSIKGFGGSLTINGAGRIFLDDENTVELEPYSIVNSRLSYKFRLLSLYLDIENVFNSSYNSSGYLLYGDVFLYPARLRSIRAGLVFDLPYKTDQ